MPWLSLIVFTPLIGAFFVAVIPRDNEGGLQKGAFLFSLVPFALSLGLLAGAWPATRAMHMRMVDALRES